MIQAEFPSGFDAGRGVEENSVGTYKGTTERGHAGGDALRPGAGWDGASWAGGVLCDDPRHSWRWSQPGPGGGERAAGEPEHARSTCALGGLGRGLAASRARPPQTGTAGMSLALSDAPSTGAAVPRQSAYVLAFGCERSEVAK